MRRQPLSGQNISGYLCIIRLFCRHVPGKKIITRSRGKTPSVPGKCGLHGELFFFLIKKEPVASNEVPSNSFVSAETLRACALMGPHVLAAEAEAGSGGGQSLDFGDMWRHGCPMSPDWTSSCSASETSFGCEEYEHNNELPGH